MQISNDSAFDHLTDHLADKYERTPAVPRFPLAADAALPMQPQTEAAAVGAGSRTLEGRRIGSHNVL